MSAPTHTPGPHEVSSGFIVVEPRSGRVLANCIPMGISSLDVPPDEARANARLFAAAADMHFALQLTQRTVDGSFADGWTIRVTGHEMKAIRAALAKAVRQL